MLVTTMCILITNLKLYSKKTTQYTVYVLFSNQKQSSDENKRVDQSATENMFVQTTYCNNDLLYTVQHKVLVISRSAPAHNSVALFVELLFGTNVVFLRFWCY